MNNILHKISQYADDTSITVVGDESIARLEYHLDLYERASGAKVNREKCEGLWLGSNQSRADKPLGFRWTSDRIKVLGIHIGNMELSHTIWDEKIDKFIRTLNLWKMRDLSLKGKKTVINFLAAACLWYPAYVYHLPDWALKKLNEALWTFLWGSKKDPVKRAVVKLPYEMGGLQIVDLEKKSKAIKMTWIAKLFDENCPGKFKHTMIEILNQYKDANFGKNVFKLFLSSYYIRQLPQFYSKLLITWANFLQDRRCKPNTIGQILTEPLFDNTFLPTLKDGGKQLTFLPDWCRAEITEIQDLTYGVIPKLLPCEAIKELLTKRTKRTEKQHAMVLNSIPKEWLQILKTETGKPDESFSIKLTPDTKPKKVTELTCRWLYTALILDEARSTELSYRQAWGITFGPINWENT